MNDRNKRGIGDLLHEIIFAGVDFAGSLLKNKRKKRVYSNSDPDIIDMPQPPAVYEHKPGVKFAGILMAITGFFCGGASLLWSLVLLLGSALVGEIGFGLGLFGVNLLLVGGCMYLGAKGVSMIGSVNRFSTYVKTIGQEELCNIKQLADRVGKSTNYVTKDVEKMIQKGWFCQGHLDDKKTCLMVTDDMYREYQKLEREKKQLQMEEEERRRKQTQKETSQKKVEKPQTEIQRVLEQGDGYVRQIRKCNDAILGEVISAKIDHMELLVNRIFDRVEQKPECVGDIRKLTEYYLPTTIKLLETYAEMDAQPVGGENIQSTKREIEDSLDTINVAFEKLLDSLYQDTAWDVSSDISVLKTMLAQEGLSEDGFNRK
ncbi:MAG: 5-bromo-4-chloroindolyl phosphate hydrolysis family protein [Lachnospiraceae bacterium]|nr:5-bromo-4-chloroindolyl phosphate hydrolysis family protein [Lachnospiraceae bacterium]